ncbi:hypothetical protein LTR22_027245 [Elasticomyces elasticus]|nr:hypothetical protein LTR22_027245 [Elasticomyces elasticus]
MITLNPDDKATTSGLERQTWHGYASSESESPRTGGSTGRKCASRIRTRRVTALSASQVERKRTHDREAKRAIRRWTKEHIETLEKTASGLRGSQESNEKVLAVTQQRNRNLEDEVAYLRSKLHEGGYVPGAPLVHSMHARPSHRPLTDIRFHMFTAWFFPAADRVPAGCSHLYRDDARPEANARLLTIVGVEIARRNEQCTHYADPATASTGPIKSASSCCIPLSPSTKRKGLATVLQHHQHPVISDTQRSRLNGVSQTPSLTPAIVHEQYAHPPAHIYTRSPLPPMTPQQQTYLPAQLPQQADRQGMVVLGHQVHPSHSYQHTTQQQPYP